MSTEQFTQVYLLYVVMPIWLLAGFADWLCHRRTHIESTTGAPESLLHLLGIAEVGVAVLMGLFFDITALVLVIMIAAFIAHEVTISWDVHYASERRHISPAEQRVHNYLSLVPLLALSLVFVLHWPQLLALVGAGPESPDFGLRWKNDPLPLAYLVTLLTLIVLFEIVPFCEELIRGLRAYRRR